MKILHVIDYFQPQIGYQESHLARIQTEKGHDVRVITSNLYLHFYNNLSSSESIFDSNKTKYDIGFNKEQGIDVLRLSNIGPVIFDKPWLKDLESNIIDFDPDVIHVHGIVSLTALRVACLKNKLKNSTKLIFDDHMTFDAMRNSQMSILYKIFKLVFVGVIKKNTDEFVAVTEETKLFMIKMYGISSENIKIIEIGCDTKQFQRNNHFRTHYRKKFGINDEIVFCYAGKITQSKGVHLFIDAAIDIIKLGKRIKVLCIGAYDEKYLNNIKSKITESNLDDYFIFIPAVPNRDLYKYYSMADVGVWPKKCSMTVLEAMSCKIPVIVSDDTGAPERVLENYNGLFYDHDDVKSLRDKMLFYLHKEHIERMGNNSYHFVKKYDWNNISEKFEKLYSR